MCVNSIYSRSEAQMPVFFTDKTHLLFDWNIETSIVFPIITKRNELEKTQQIENELYGPKRCFKNGLCVSSPTAFRYLFSYEFRHCLETHTGKAGMDSWGGPM